MATDRRARSGLLGVALAISALAGWAVAGAESTELTLEPPSPIVLGMSADFSGPARGLGIELYRGARAYFDEINERGGVAGRSIVLDTRDDRYEPRRTLENTEQFLNDQRILALFGYVGTATAGRTLPLLKLRSSEGLRLYFPLSGAQPPREPPYGANAFNLRASFRQETAALVHHFLASGLTRIAVYHQADAFGRSGWNGVRLALAENGVKIVAEATFDRRAKYEDSFRQQVELLGGARPQAIIAAGSYAGVAGMVRDARDAGLLVPIATISAGADSSLELLNAEAKKSGRDYTSGLLFSQVVPNFENVALPAVREYREVLDRRNPPLDPAWAANDYPTLRYSLVSLEGFLDAKLFVEILRRAGDPPTRALLTAAAENLHEFDLGIGVPVGFAGGRRQAQDRVLLAQVEDGRFVTLAQARAAAVQGAPPR